jgi:hypothetical protein
MAESTQVKSRERVAAHGEVFTAEREVKAMCDLVKSETERIESRFLEPACGNGNFLAEVLTRKLAVVTSRYGKSPHEYERYAVLALSSLYGVELLEDNAVECRQRLYSLWEQSADAVADLTVSKECLEAVRFLLKRNILCGDALTLLQSDGTPIVFSEWSLISGDLMKRRDFRLDKLISGESEKQKRQGLLYTPGWEYDSEQGAFIPSPVQEFPPVEYWRVHHA